MEITNQTEINNEILPEPERPQFLTVLCILTWICAGFMFLASIYGVLNKPSAEDQMEQVEKIRAINPDIADQMEVALEAQDSKSQIISTIIGFVSQIISVLGAMLMWQLKRKGFYIYLLGELLPYLGFVFAGSEIFSTAAAASGMSVSRLMGMAATILILFDGIFIALYASNLKHMKN